MGVWRQRKRIRKLHPPTPTVVASVPALPLETRVEGCKEIVRVLITLALSGAMWIPVYPQPARTSPTHQSGFQGNLGPMKHVPLLLVGITMEVSTMVVTTMVATIMEDTTMEDSVMEDIIMEDLTMEEMVDLTMEDLVMEEMVDLTMEDSIMEV